MTTPASGPLHLAGETGVDFPAGEGPSVAEELGRSNVRGEISLNDADVRELAGKPLNGSHITMLDLRGKGLEVYIIPEREPLNPTETVGAAPDLQDFSFGELKGGYAGADLTELWCTYYYDGKGQIIASRLGAATGAENWPSPIIVTFHLPGGGTMSTSWTRSGGGNGTNFYLSPNTQVQGIFNAFTTYENQKILISFN